MTYRWPAAGVAVGGMVAVAVSDAAPLTVPAGYEVTRIASGLGNARGMAFAPDGDLYVCVMEGDGYVIALSPSEEGWTPRVVVTGLEMAHSLAFHDGKLWVAETGRVRRFPGWRGPFTAKDGTVVVDGLPRGGHVTRTIMFLPDGRFLLSIGSSCNLCEEEDHRRAAVMVFDANGENGRVFSLGLRNAVGLTLRPGTGEIWATNNGRDWLGDEKPPDFIYVLEDGKNYGFPYTLGDGTPDPTLGRAGFVQTGLPAAALPAHCAPLGLAFWRGDLYVAVHGSWNRSRPFPPQVVKLDMSRWTPGAAAEFDRKAERFTGPFATGFLEGFQDDEGRRRGRPVSVVAGPDGSLYVSDDFAGSIYRVTPAGGR